MRGFGAMQMVFGYESQIDRVAHALDLDPVEIRALNALRRGDTLPVGQVVETHVALPELAARAWAGLGEPSPPRSPHVRIGRGLASNFQPYGRIVWLHDWSSAWVGFEMDGSLVIRCGVPDVGGGQASSLCQIAAEVLGVELEDVTIHIADSALTPLAGTTTASRQLYMSGNAVLKACRELRTHILGVAAAMLGTEPHQAHPGRERRGRRPTGADCRSSTCYGSARASVLRAVISACTTRRPASRSISSGVKGRCFPTTRSGPTQ